MGMTLSMDPDSRNAVVGNIVEQGQAFRAVRDRQTDVRKEEVCDGLLARKLPTRNRG